MNPPASNNKPAETLVGMGQIVLAQSPQRMHAILGSCVGLALFAASRKTGVMAHIVLPESAGRDGTPGKFADTALPEMLAVLRREGVPTHNLTAKLAGGANMFNGSGPLRIGDANAAAAMAALQKAGIPLAAHDLGGARGRRVDFHTHSGEMIVQSAGQPPRIL